MILHDQTAQGDTCPEMLDEVHHGRALVKYLMLKTCNECDIVPSLQPEQKG